jgi:hypothetical protein
LGEPEMDPFALAGWESFPGFTEAWGLAELAEEDGRELFPAAKSGGALALVVTEDLFKVVRGTCSSS